MATGGGGDPGRYPQHSRSDTALPALAGQSDGRGLYEVQSLPDVQNLLRRDFCSDQTFSPSKQISVLILIPRWHFDTYGISCISKSLISNLRAVDPDAVHIKIYCAVLEEAKKIPQDQLNDAEKYKVVLLGASQPRGKRRKPDIKWLDEDINKYYQHVLINTKFDFIIGHVPYVADGVLNLKDQYKKLGHEPTVILVIHTMPKTDEGGEDEERLEEWLREADLILSVGGNVWMRVNWYVKAADISVDHELYLPGVLTNIPKGESPQRRLSGEQNILIMVSDGEDVDNSGLDLEMAVVSSAQATQNILFNEGATLSRQLSINVKVVGTNEDTKAAWEENFHKIKEKHNILTRSPSFKFCVPRKPEKLRPLINRAAVVVLPLKQDTTLFGTETLNALLAGVPVLVSKNSGLASLLEDKGMLEPVVWDNQEFAKATETWKKRLIQKITNPEEAQLLAKELQEVLKVDTKTVATHRNFVAYVTSSLSAKIEVDIEAEAVSPQLVAAAIKSGVGLRSRQKPLKPSKFVAAYLKKLAYSYEEDKVSEEVGTTLKDVLLCLEERGRKLVMVADKRVTLTLFCPTVDSRKQLYESTWIKRLTESLGNLVKLLGVDAELNIKREDMALLGEVSLPQRLQKRKVRHLFSVEAASDGYETMTEASEDTKVEHWLSLMFTVVPPGDMPPVDQEHPYLRFVETFDQASSDIQSMNSFAVSIDGSIGITSQPSLSENHPEEEWEDEGAMVAKSPSISVMYPGSAKPSVTLSDDKEFWSAVFIGNNPNLLAATCSHDNSIHLWDVEKRASKVVYQFQSNVEERKILCLIDDKTVACRDVGRPVDGVHQVEILSTTTEPWSLKTVVHINSVKDIYNMCYMQTVDGTACLLLCSPRDHFIQAVEMIGSHVRWVSGKQQQMKGPLSVCIDAANTVYVSDFVENKLFFLNSEDGTIFSYVNLAQYNFVRPFCLCVHDEHLYVGHLDEKEEKP